MSIRCALSSHFLQHVMSMVCLILAAPAYGQGFDYQFSADGVLPSAQLATYGGDLPEGAVYSVIGGVLYQSTLAAVNDVASYYEVPGVFDHSLPATLEWRARLVACAGACQASAAVSLLDDGYHWLVNLDPQGVAVAIRTDDGYAYPVVVPMDTTDTMHTYRLEIQPGGSAYSLFVDGRLAYSGSAYTLIAPTTVWWGDGTPTGGNAAVEWDFIRFRNGTAYSVCPLYNQDTAKKIGSTVPIKLQLCDAGGANLSASAVLVRAVSLVKVSDNTTSVVEDAGNANPDDNFRFDEDHYIFNLKTSGLQPGTYRIQLKAGDDPTTHTVSIQLR